MRLSFDFESLFSYGWPVINYSQLLQTHYSIVVKDKNEDRMVGMSSHNRNETQQN